MVNPVPDPADPPMSARTAATTLLELDKRKETMQNTTPTQPTRNERRRPWLIAAAAAAIVIIAGASVLLLTRDTGPDVADGEPEATARRFIDARDTWDGEAAVALFAPDAVISGEHGIAAVEDYPALFSWFQATDWRYTVEECTVTMAGPPAEVTCTYTQENAWSRALQVESGPGTFDFITSNGQILKLHRNPVKGFYSPVVGKFFGWVLTTHQEDIEVLYLASPDLPRLTPESIALWEEYTNEFVASVTDSSTP
jgi:hypothetical protein